MFNILYMIKIKYKQHVVKTRQSLRPITIDKINKAKKIWKNP